MATSSSGPEAPASVASLRSFWENGGNAASDVLTSGGAPAGTVAHKRRWGSEAAPGPADQDSPPLKRSSGSGGEVAAAAARVERQLWEGKEAGEAEGSEQDAAEAEVAREARLAKIQAKFGTKRFLPACELPPDELRRQLGAEDGDLAADDYTLVRWEPMSVVLSGTSNAYCCNWVLKGQDMPRLQSGSVGLASSLLHLFVLGAGQTIFIADADAVHASQDEGSVVLRLGEGDFLTVRVPSPEAAAQLVATVNGRAATRAALRHKGAAVAAAAGGSAAAEAGP